MEILIGLAVATVLLIGWGYGSMAVAIFLTLGEVFLSLLFSAASTEKPTIFLMTAVLVAMTWAPILWKHFKNKPLQHRDDRLTISVGDDKAGDVVGGVLTVLAFIAVGWMFLHDTADTWSWISSRPFLTVIGVAAIIGLGLGWANKAI